MKIALKIHIMMLFSLSLFVTSAVVADEPQPAPTFEQAFQSGIQNFQAKKYALAIENFKQASVLEPESTANLTNWALAEFQQGQKALAVALLRKALALDPDFSTPKAALKFIEPQLEVKEIPHEILWTENMRSQFLQPVPLNVYLGLSVLFLFAGGWILLSYFGTRKRAFQNDQVLPNFPNIGSLMALGFVLCLFLSLAKIWDYQIPRGTVIDAKVSVMSAPEEKSVALFDLYGGLEVILKTSDSNWVQVSYPGALTGWVPKKSILPTSGKKTW